MKNSRSLPQSSIRMPKELKDWIIKKSMENFRSINSEIVARLEESRKREEQSHAQA